MLLNKFNRTMAKACVELHPTKGLARLHGLQVLQRRQVPGRQPRLLHAQQLLVLT